MKLSSQLSREQLARRVTKVLAEEPAKEQTPTERHAAFAVLRAARLVSVGNWLAHRLQDRLVQLERTMAASVRKGLALPELFKLWDAKAKAAYDWMAGEAQDALHELLATLVDQGVEAASAHFDVDAGYNLTAGELPLVLGATVQEHFDKQRDDLLFRLKAAARQAVQAGATPDEVVERLGLDQPKDATAKARETVSAALDVSSAINVGVRLFDLSDNSLMKMVQAAMTELASAADQETADAIADASDQDVRMGFTWVSAGDVRVCEFCEFMDGNQWDADKQPVGDGPELEQEPPAHLGCRCALLPCDLDDEAPSGSFSDYLAGFSQSEQEQAFGKSALKAYRSGEITPAQLMGQGENEISLEKFKELEPRLETDVEKYARMGRESGAAANQVTRERRVARA